MGWFGSLELAYKYAIVFGSLLIATLAAGAVKVYLNRRKLRNHVRAADLEAAEKKGKQLEQNSRKLDEGDLFGIRAIESGYFGGVPQSRPTSAVGIHSPSGSFGRASRGGRPSRKIFSASPSGSVVNLAMGSRRCSSPLAMHVVSQANDDLEPSHSKRTQPEPVSSKLQPSSAENHGRTKHDPAVHMSWMVPPSPTTDTSPVSDTSIGNNEFCSPSSSSQTAHTSEAQHGTASIPLITFTKVIRGSVQHVPAPRPLVRDIKPQSRQMVSSDAGNTSFAPGRPREPGPNIVITNPPQLPSRAATAARPIHSVKHVSLIRDGQTLSMLDRARDSSILAPTVPRPVSTVGQWGAEVFRELDADTGSSSSGCSDSDVTLDSGRR